MLDYITLLLDSQASDKPLIKPRLPALFEPRALNMEGAFFEDSLETAVRESASAEQQADAPPVSHQIAQVLPRERTPYRGNMNLPPTPRMRNAAESISAASGTALRAMQPNVSPPDQSRSGYEESSPHRPETPSFPQIAHALSDAIPPAQTAIRPSQIPQATGSEPRVESELQNSPAPETAPIVRVSIGRIVVRAVAQPPPAERIRESKSKKLSLDDYLKKGERGER